MTVTTTSTPVPVYTDNDAGFRTLMKAINDALISSGCTQEFSNIDFDTVLMPTSTQIDAGKRVYAFNDDLHAERPIFIQLTFGRGLSSAAYHRMGFQLKIAMGTNHTAGTVTGTFIEHYIVFNARSVDNGQLITARSDKGLSLFSNIDMDASDFQFGFLIERTSLDGVANTDGAILLVFGYQADTIAVSGNNSVLVLHAANFVQGFAYTANLSSGNETSTQCSVSATADPSYDDKAPVFPVYTYGGYDPLSLVLKTSSAYLPSQLFTAKLNGVVGKWRTLFGTYNTWSIKSYMAFRVE